LFQINENDGHFEDEASEVIAATEDFVEAAIGDVGKIVFAENVQSPLGLDLKAAICKALSANRHRVRLLTITVYFLPKHENNIR
jgi:hypothetical protein